MKRIKWVKWKGFKNHFTGLVDGEECFAIEGNLALHDLRESRKSTVCIRPKTYSIKGTYDAKSIAVDLLNDFNL